MLLLDDELVDDELVDDDELLDDELVDDDELLDDELDGVIPTCGAGGAPKATIHVPRLGSVPPLGSK